MKKIIVFLLLPFVSVAQSGTNLSFILSVKDPVTHMLHVHMVCEGVQKEAVEFKLSAWTPGYYQLMHYADNVSAFHATTASGDSLVWKKNSDNSWLVNSRNAKIILLEYDVKAPRAFVAANYVDAERAYISPAGVFVYPSELLHHAVTVAVEPYAGWTTIATGLESVKDKTNTFIAPDYDVLYDSPFLMGQLESFPSFTVRNVPHYFVAYKPGDFDKARFMNDMQKIITTASDIIGDIPYDHYTFLAIGPGGGGIEHLNSASVSFQGTRIFNSKASMLTSYHFLAHEYFHHYNVKRIRPVELGPFDYDKGSRTKMLWLSEGVNVYYEYMIVHRAGFDDADDLLKIFSNSIKEYENKPGRNYQTSAEASYTTWEDGPFGRTGDDAYKTISPYDKGPALGMLLDFKIRHETKNKKSLDDLMRLLYNKYYKEKKRGFTEKEFRDEAEKMAGIKLDDFFDYIYTLKTDDYPTYLNYAGLTIDTTTHELPGSWIGLTTRSRGDSVVAGNVEYNSPAWNAGIRNRTVILKVNNEKPNDKTLPNAMLEGKPGAFLSIVFSNAGEQKEAMVELKTKKERSYTITRNTNPDALQSAILKSWLVEK